MRPWSRHMLMRCTPMRSYAHDMYPYEMHAHGGCTPMRCTPVRYTPMRHAPSRSPILWSICRDLKIRVFALVVGWSLLRAVAGPYRARSRSCQRPTFMKDITYEQYGRTRRNAPVAVFCCTRAELYDSAVAVAAPINKISCCNTFACCMETDRWPAAKGKGECPS